MDFCVKKTWYCRKLIRNELVSFTCRDDVDEDDDEDEDEDDDDDDDDDDDCY